MYARLANIHLPFLPSPLTALCPSCARVRKIQPDLPENIEKETQARLAEIARLLSSIAPGVQGINRYRYSRWMSGIEELIEALTFAHYLRTQSLMGYDDAVQLVAALSRSAPDEMDVDVDAGDPHPPAAEGVESLPPVHVTEQDYLMGIFDLSGEMMRFATIVAALSGSMAGGVAGGEERTIGRDMQELGSFFETLPQQHDKGYSSKMHTLRQSVFKVEKLGYGLTVRGSERPAGWMPDTSDEVPDADE